MLPDHLNERPPTVRRKKADFQGRVNRDMAIEFTGNGSRRTQGWSGCFGIYAAWICRIRSAVQRWQRVEDGVDGFLTSVAIKKRDRTIEVSHLPQAGVSRDPKELSARLVRPGQRNVGILCRGTSLCFEVRRLWRFMGGRGLGRLVRPQGRLTLRLQRYKQLTVTDFGDPPSVSSDIAPHSVPRTVAKAGGSMDRATRIA